VNYSSSGNDSIEKAIASRYSSGEYSLPGYHTSVTARYQVPAIWKYDPSRRSDAKINYVIASWSGYRRNGNERYQQDITFYVKEHLKSLEITAHSIAQITLAVPNNPEEPEQFIKYIESLPKHINGVPLVIFHRENRGQSYGSYSDVFLKYRGSFDYFIFIEDDYIFMLNNFDEILIQMFEASENCGYWSCNWSQYYAFFTCEITQWISFLFPLDILQQIEGVLLDFDVEPSQIVYVSPRY